MIVIAALVSAFQPAFRLLTLAGAGLLLAHRRTRLVQASTFSILGKLFHSIFLPSLILTHLGLSLTLHGLPGQWWLLPLNALLSTAVGGAMGFAVQALSGPPPPLAPLVVAMTAIGDGGGLSIAVVESVCRGAGSSGLFGPDCRRNGFAYASLSQLLPLLLAYVVMAYGIVWPTPRQSCTGSNKEDPVLHTGRKGEYQAVSSVAVPEVEIVIACHVDGEDTHHGGSPSQQSANCTIGARNSSIHARMRRLIPMIRIIAQLPALATLAAVILGLVPKLGGSVFGSSASVVVVTDSLNILSRAAVPSLMLVVGGMLSQTPRAPSQSGIEQRTVVAIALARLLVLPLVGVGTVIMAGKLGILVHGDNMMRLILMLQWATPSAILFGRWDLPTKDVEKGAFAVLVWQFAGWLISIAFYLAVYFMFLVESVR